MEKTEMVFLLGLSGSGKDTVGQEFINKGYTRVAFADVLKEEYAAMKGIPLESLHIQGPAKEAHREAIIEYAETQRAIDPLHWIKKAIEPYLESHSSIREGLKLVFTDVRRRSELDWIYHIKSIEDRVDEGEIISHYERARLFIVDRPGIIDNDMLSHETIGYARGMQRASEFQVVDATIINDGTKEDLAKKVERLCRAYAF